MKRSKDRANGVFFGGDWRRIPHLTNFTQLVCRQPERARCIHHQQWGLDYHVEAAGEYSLDRRHWRRRKPHTANLYATGRIYWERSKPAHVPFQETYLTFSIADSCDLDPLVAAGNGFARFLDPEGLLAAAFQRLAQHDGPIRAWRGQAALYDILSLLLSTQPLTGEDRLVAAGTPPSAHPFAERIEEYVRAHYHEPLSLAAMARVAGVSLSTLTQWDRLFSLPLPVTITFGTTTFSKSDLLIEGKAAFTPTGVMTKANGLMTGYIYRSSTSSDN